MTVKVTVMTPKETQLEKAQREALEAEEKLAKAKLVAQESRKRQAAALKKEASKVRETFASDIVEALTGKTLTDAETITLLPNLLNQLQGTSEFVELQRRLQQSRVDDSPTSNDTSESSSVPETSVVMEQSAMPNVTYDHGQRY